MPFDIYQWLNKELRGQGANPYPWQNPYWENWYGKWYRPPNYSMTGGEAPASWNAQAAGQAAFSQLAIPFLTPVDVKDVLTSLKQTVPATEQGAMAPLFNAADWEGWTRTQQRTAAHGFEGAFTQAARLQKFQQLLDAIEVGENENTAEGVAWMSLPESVRNWIRNVLSSATSYYSKRRTYGEQLEFLNTLSSQLNTQFPQPSSETANVNTISPDLVAQIAQTLKRLVLPTMVGPGWGQTGWTPIGGAAVSNYRGRGGWY